MRLRNHFRSAIEIAVLLGFIGIKEREKAGKPRLDITGTTAVLDGTEVSSIFRSSLAAKIIPNPHERLITLQYAVALGEVKIGAKVVRHGRYVNFQLAELAVLRSLFQKTLGLIEYLRRRYDPASAKIIDGKVKTTGDECLDDENIVRLGVPTRPNNQDQAVECQRKQNHSSGGAIWV